MHVEQEEKLSSHVGLDSTSDGTMSNETDGEDTIQKTILQSFIHLYVFLYMCEVQQSIMRKFLWITYFCQLVD